MPKLNTFKNKSPVYIIFNLSQLIRQYCEKKFMVMQVKLFKGYNLSNTSCNHCKKR